MGFEETQRLFYGMDPDGTGSISIEEFASAIKSHEKARKRRELHEAMRNLPQQ